MDNFSNAFEALSAMMEKIHEGAVNLGRLQAKKEMLDFTQSLHERELISDEAAQMIMMELSFEL